MINHELEIKQLGLQAYEPIWRAMQAYTDERNAGTPDQLWILEHEPVFTQGQKGKPEHLLNPGDIPVIQVDRGGQITYHGPGQLIIYFLIDIRRRKLGVRQLVNTIENSVIDYLSGFNIEAYAKPDAPGIYVNEAKIGSLGLRIRRGCSFHGLSFNVNMDLEPFRRINPCGYQGLQMTQLAELGGPQSVAEAASGLVSVVKNRLCPIL